jgi:hypothetical protein
LENVTKDKFRRLLRLGLLTERSLDDIIAKSVSCDTGVEELLMVSGIPKSEILTALSEHYKCPSIEYEEGLMAPYLLRL